MMRMAPAGGDTGRDIFEEYVPGSAAPMVPPGEPWPGGAITRAAGFNVVATDPVAFGVMQALLQEGDARRDRVEGMRRGFDGLLFVTSTEGLADSLASRCHPAPGECCLFIDTAGGSGAPRCHLLLGDQARVALQRLLREPGGSRGHALVGKWVASLLDEGTSTTLQPLADLGTLRGTSRQLALAVLSFGFAFYAVVALAMTLARRAVPTAEETPNLDTVSGGLESSLGEWIARHLTPEAQRAFADDDGTGERPDPPSFATDGFGLDSVVPEALKTLPPLVRRMWRALPDAAWAFGVLAEELQNNYESSRFVEQAAAILQFQLALADSVLSMKGVSTVVQQNAAAIRANQDQLRDLALAAGNVGGTAFLAGTTWGVLYDLGDTLVTLVYYSFVGMRWVFHQQKAALELAFGAVESLGPPDVATDALAADETVAAWFPPIDLEALLTEELPALYRQVKAMCLALRDDFIANAAEWGRMAGEYLVTLAGEGVNAALAAALDPYPADAGVMARIWYTVQQWFYVGSVLGPILVDIVLTFCTGGAEGVVSAALKLGKFGDLKTFFRVGETGTDAVRKLALFAYVERLVPDHLGQIAGVLRRILEQAWHAVGPLTDQLLGIVGDLKASLPAVDLEWWASAIDQLYNWASSLNLLVGTFLLISGTAETDKHGNLVEAPA